MSACLVVAIIASVHVRVVSVLGACLEGLSEDPKTYLTKQYLTVSAVYSSYWTTLWHMPTTPYTNKTTCCRMTLTLDKHTVFTYSSSTSVHT